MISVVIPTYNSAAYLREALRSVFAQTMLPDEILVVDDCSEDETCDIVERCRAESPMELRLLRMPKNTGGPVGPMNFGITEARGEFIAMLDHDDVMLPERLAAALPACAEHEKVGMVFGQTIFVDGNGRLREFNHARYAEFTLPRQQFSAQELLDDLLTHGYRYGGAGGMLFRKAAWADVGGFAESYKIAWDCEFTFRLALAGWSFVYVAEVLYHHRIHARNLQHTGGGKSLVLEYLELYNQLGQSPGLSTRQQHDLKKMLSDRYNRLANISLLEKQYRESAKNYCQSISKGGFNWRALKGFLRIPYYFFYKNRVPPRQGD